MKAQFTPTHTTLIGVTILMACACGAGSSSANLFKLARMNITSKVTHSFLLGGGAFFILRGLWQIHRRAVVFAALSFVALAAAAALTPPMMMSAAHEPWHGAQIAGSFLYLIFAVLLGYAFWIAFPISPTRSTARAIALVGTTASVGCACCMVTGALSPVSR